MSLRRTPLMVTEDGYHAIRVIVCIQLLLNCGDLWRALVQLLLEGYGCVISTKHLGGQALHIRLKMFVQESRLGILSTLKFLRQRPQLRAYVDTIKQVVAFFLVVLKQADVFEHLWLNGNAVIVPDRVFTEEIKDNEIGSLKRDMFAAQRATADRICFIFPLFITRTKSQSIDEIHGSRPLSVSHDLALQVGLIICTDSRDITLNRNESPTQERNWFRTLSSRAFSNFDISLWPFSELPAAKNTYL